MRQNNRLEYNQTRKRDLALSLGDEMRRFLLLIAVLLTCTSGAIYAQTAKPDQTVVVTGRREASEASWTNKCIRYIPFTVPAGATKITIKISCDWGPNKSEGHTLDTGLFDPRGYGFSGPGFRGWAGGNSEDIVVTGDHATTGRFYVPGPLYPGEWNIVQRFLKSTKAGLNYKYTITCSFDGPTPPTTAVPVPKCDQGIIDPKAGWYPGEMHMHTIHSDGNKTLVQSIEQHEAQGYRFMVSTDHNTYTAHYDFADAARVHPEMLLIYGEEFTAAPGHANLVGMKPGSWVDFRLDVDDPRITDIIDTSHELGALFYINHPCSIKWRYPQERWTKADGIEVWNGGFGSDDAQAVLLWESQIKAGRHMAAVGGTDTHGGTPRTATFVYAPNLSSAAILQGMRKEHMFVSESPKGPMLLLASGTSLPGDTAKANKDGYLPVKIHVIGGKGKTLRLIWSSSEEKIAVDSDDFRLDRKLKIDTTQKHCYVRAELLNPDGNMSALTNAIYVN